MYGKGKCSAVPSDAQSREKLAMFVYEYLLHVGAGKAASIFLQEIGWNKEIQLSESPGFLHSWWCVFWDLYCASPEKRETCAHSTEAKVFYEYAASSIPMNSMVVEGMGQPGMPTNYYPHYGSPRYPGHGSRPGMQGHGSHQLMPGMDHAVRSQMIGVSRMPHSVRMPHGAGNPYGPEQFQQSYSGMRMPTTSMSAHGNMSSVHPRSPWTNPAAASGPPSAGPPTTPMMRSPPDSMSPDFNQISKSLPHQSMSSMFSMGAGGSDGMPSSSIPAAQGTSLPVSTPMTSLNGINGTGPDPAMLDAMSKNSPTSNLSMGGTMGPGSVGPMAPPTGAVGTPHTPQDGDGDAYGLVSFGDSGNTALNPF